MAVAADKAYWRPFATIIADYRNRHMKKGGRAVRPDEVTPYATSAPRGGGSSRVPLRADNIHVLKKLLK